MLAQLEEQEAFNFLVPGSSPGRPTKFWGCSTIWECTCFASKRLSVQVRPAPPRFSLWTRKAAMLFVRLIVDGMSTQRGIGLHGVVASFASKTIRSVRFRYSPPLKGKKMNIKDIVKDNTVSFQFYRQQHMYYEICC